MPFLSLKVSPGRKEGRGPWDGCAEQILKALCSALGPTEASVPDCVCLSFHWMKWDSNVCIIHRETSTWRQQQRAVLLLLQNIYIAERGHEWKWTVCIIQNLSAIKVKYVLFFFYNLLAHLFNLWEKNYRKLFFFSWSMKYSVQVQMNMSLCKRMNYCLSFSSFSSNSTGRLFSHSLCCFFFMWLVAHWNKFAILLLTQCF